jgi:hypothetical protein
MSLELNPLRSSGDAFTTPANSIGYNRLSEDRKSYIKGKFPHLITGVFGAFKRNGVAVTTVSLEVYTDGQATPAVATVNSIPILQVVNASDIIVDLSGVSNITQKTFNLIYPTVSVPTFAGHSIAAAGDLPDDRPTIVDPVTGINAS